MVIVVLHTGSTCNNNIFISTYFIDAKFLSNKCIMLTLIHGNVLTGLIMRLGCRYATNL